MVTLTNCSRPKAIPLIRGPQRMDTYGPRWNEKLGAVKRAAVSRRVCATADEKCAWKHGTPAEIAIKSVTEVTSGGR